MRIVVDVLLLSVVLTVIVGVHELGHLAMARALGARVEAFSLGFGRVLWRRRDRAGVEWRLSALPLGGYVVIPGMADGAGGGPRLPASRRVAIAAAGPLANLALYLAAFVVAVSVVGIPGTAPVVTAVVPGSPAEAAGLLPGDVVVAVDGRAVRTVVEMRLQLAALDDGDPSRRASLSTTRGGVAATRDVGLLHRDVRVPTGTVSVPYVGVSFEGAPTVSSRVGLGEALTAAVADGVQLVSKTWDVLAQVASDPTSQNLTGPIALGSVLGPTLGLGLGHFLRLAASFSLSIGLFNLQPIPILDGGVIAIALYEGATGGRVSPRLMSLATRSGFVLLAALMLSTSLRELYGVVGYAFGR